MENCATLEIPELFVRLIDKLEQEGIFTAEERPDTCCVNILKEEQWLPPRVDSKRFERPIFTISLLSEQVSFCVDFLLVYSTCFFLFKLCCAITCSAGVRVSVSVFVHISDLETYT